MEEIKKEKKQRDWLGTWTILVLPGLCWSFLLWNNTSRVLGPFYGLTTWGDYVEVAIMFILIFSPAICLIWAIMHFFFVRNARTPNKITRRIQVVFNIALSLLIIGILANELLSQKNKKCDFEDYLNPENKPWCRMQAL